MYTRVQSREPGARCRLAVFLGSGDYYKARRCEHGTHTAGMLGGHTSEMLTLVSALDFTRYTPRTYIVSEGDTLSAQKAVDLEKARQDPAKVHFDNPFHFESDFLFRSQRKTGHPIY